MMQDGKTALMLSIQTKSDTVATALIEKGADANIVDKVKYFIHVLFLGTIFFQLVIEHDVVLQYGKTALMLSIQTKSDTVGIALIEKGVDANIVDKVKYLIHVLFPRTIFFQL